VRPKIYGDPNPTGDEVEIMMGRVVIPFRALSWGGEDGDELASWKEGIRSKPGSRRVESSDAYWVPNLNLVIAKAIAKMIELRREFLITSLKLRGGQENLERAQRIQGRLRLARQERNARSRQSKQHRPTVGQLTLLEEDPK